MSASKRSKTSGVAEGKTDGADSDAADAAADPPSGTAALSLSSTVRLNNGRSDMPRFGMGLSHNQGGFKRDAVLCALDSGVLLFDTAKRYGNEADLGEAIDASKVGRGRREGGRDREGERARARVVWGVVRLDAIQRAVQYVRSSLAISRPAPFTHLSSYHSFHRPSHTPPTHLHAPTHVPTPAHLITTLPLNNPTGTARVSLPHHQTVAGRRPRRKAGLCGVRVAPRWRPCGLVPSTLARGLWGGR